MYIVHYNAFQVHLAAQSQQSLAEDVFHRLDELEEQAPITRNDNQGIAMD